MMDLIDEEEEVGKQEAVDAGLTEERNNAKFTFYKAADIAAEDNAKVWFRGMSPDEYATLRDNNELSSKINGYGGISPTFEYAKKYITNEGDNDCIVEFVSTVDITALFEKLGWKRKPESSVMSWGLGPTGNTPVKDWVSKLGKSGQLKDVLVGDDEVDDPIKEYLTVDVTGKDKKETRAILEEQKEKASQFP